MNNVANFMNGPAGVVITLLLLAILAAREVARISGGRRRQALARALSVAATPLLVIFLAAVAILLVQAFR